MAKKIIPQRFIDKIVNEWELGMFKNVAKLAEANKEFGYKAISRIIRESKAIRGSREDELQEYISSCTDLIVNPTKNNEIKEKRVQNAREAIGIVDIFDSAVVAESATGLVALDIMEKMEGRLSLSSVILTVASSNTKVRKDSKKLVFSSKEHGIMQTDVPLDSSDLKNYMDIFDKSLVALGEAPRFAPKSDTNVGVQLNTTTDSEGNVVTTTSTVSNNINSFYDKSPMAIEG